MATNKKRRSEPIMVFPNVPARLYAVVVSWPPPSNSRSRKRRKEVVAVKTSERSACQTMKHYLESETCQYYGIEACVVPYLRRR